MRSSCEADLRAVSAWVGESGARAASFARVSAAAGRAWATVSATRNAAMARRSWIAPAAAGEAVHSAISLMEAWQRSAMSKMEAAGSRRSVRSSVWSMRA